MTNPLDAGGNPGDRTKLCTLAGLSLRGSEALRSESETRNVSKDLSEKRAN